MQYLTRANSPVRGKDKVYFTSYDGDFSKYFDKISSDILKCHNCALYYNEAGELPDEEELAMMQLIVLPISADFVYNDSYAKELCFDIAQAYGIPVLPIVVEGDVADAFDAMSGDLQFLERAKDDYLEKLQRFLDEILIDDELIERIRAEFSAYLFLSYRKCDRADAMELMRIIHSKPEFSDIAIWYDDFLVPGENFNNTIDEAIQKCKLFVIAITPNILKKNAKGEDNYVLSVEYPRALELGKPRLPVEMKKTGRAALRPHFGDAIIGKGEDDLISLAVYAATYDAEHKSSPEHDYLIGLAYLRGIDVELDRNRGVSLIGRAANGGCIEAVERLIDMYQNGDGVARNMNKAIEYNVMSCRLLYDAFLTDMSGENYVRLYKSMDDLAKRYGRASRPDKAEEVFLEILKMCNEYGGDFELDDFLYVTYMGLGATSAALGKLNEAEEYYNKSIEIQMRDGADTSDGARLNLAASLLNMGDIMRRNGDKRLASKYYNEAHDIRRALYEKEPSRDHRRILAESFFALARFEVDNDNYERAECFALEALEHYLALYEEYEYVIYRSSASACYGLLCCIHADTDNLAEAQKYARLDVEICEDIIASESTAATMASLAKAYASYATIENRMGELGIAKDFFIRASEIMLKYMNEITDIRHILALPPMLRDIGRICLKQNKPNEAEEYFKNALKIFADIAARFDTYEVLYSFSRMYRLIGDAYREYGDYDTAMRYTKRHLSVAEKIVSEYDAPEAEWELANAYERLGAQFAEGVHRDLPLAGEYFTRSLELRRGLYDSLGDDKYYAALGNAYCNLGIVTKSRENLTVAYEIYSELTARHPDNTVYENLKINIKEELDSL